MHTNAEKLEAAERLIQEVRDTLNTVKHACECCGLTVYDNEKEWVQRQMLNAAIQRVKKVVEGIRRCESDLIQIKYDMLVAPHDESTLTGRADT